MTARSAKAREIVERWDGEMRGSRVPWSRQRDILVERLAAALAEAECATWWEAAAKLDNLVAESALFDDDEADAAFLHEARDWMRRRAEEGA